jgi:hypothetical protein
LQHLNTRAAISFLTSAVRIPMDWSCSLMESEPLTKDWDSRRTHDDDGRRLRPVVDNSGPNARTRETATQRHEVQELWEVQLDEKLTNDLESRAPGFRLLSLGNLAGELQLRFPQELAAAGVTGDLIVPVHKRRGILDYRRLQWLDSAFFRVPDNPASKTSTVIAFQQSGLNKCPPWREYAFLSGSPEPEVRFDDLSAAYDLLGLLAQRRSLVSVTAQRLLCKIVLPWGRCRFSGTDGKTSKEYLLLPVLTMISRRMSSEYRRTITLTAFLLPSDDDTAPRSNRMTLPRFASKRCGTTPDRRFLSSLFSTSGRTSSTARSRNTRAMNSNRVSVFLTFLTVSFDKRFIGSVSGQRHPRLRIQYEVSSQSAGHALSSLAVLCIWPGMPEGLLSTSLRYDEIPTSLTSWKDC